ncbi:hypothetical protein [Streptomyces sp. NPDC093568]|uniref:hypothetical protein n=1 Tax=Streptomyces sp. NPDC093568 TaxID=3366041 RepID=UPI00380586C7
MSSTAAKRLLRSDSRTADVAVRETVALPPAKAQALLDTLRPGERVLALYHQGLGYAALTDNALILLAGSAPSRVSRPLVILRPAYGAAQRVDVSVDGRTITAWGSQIDVAGALLCRAGTVTSQTAADDPRTAAAFAGERISLPEDHKKKLLAELEPGEVVRSLYHCGWGYAALTDTGLVLLRNLVAPKVSRAPKPLRILRREHGVLDSVMVLVDGRQYKLHGSKLDPKGGHLAAAGELLPADSSLRPQGSARVVAWIRRHPVLISAVAAGAIFAGLGTGNQTSSARASGSSSVAVPDLKGDALTSAVAQARRHPWLRVSTADASSSFRPVKATTLGWRVCFQTPSGGETVRPSARMLTLYAVPEEEACPTRLFSSRRVVMPDLLGESFDDASRVLDDIGMAHIAAWHAHTGKRLDERSQDLDDWRVCRQEPEPDSEVLASVQAGLWLIGPGAPCTQPSPKPTPKPKPKPEPKPRADPPSRSGTVAGTTGGGSDNGGSTGGSSSSSGGATGGTGSQAGIQFGQHCSPVGATATTDDGRPAKCFMGKDGRPRWGYNSG